MVEKDAAPNNEFECGQKLQDTPEHLNGSSYSSS